MADKTLLIKLRATADGQPVVAGFGRTLDELTASEARLGRQMRETSAEARRQDGALGGVTASLRNWLGVLAGAAGIGVAAKKAFDYHEDIASTQNAIAGLLFANNQYRNSTGEVVDEQTAWNAATAESVGIIAQLQRESLKTAATVPEIGKAYALVYGALNQARITAPQEKIIELTTRLTQAANAMEVPMEQIRQEINSLLTGQITQDSMIAKRLGFDNASIKELQQNGRLVEEVLKRTEGYAKAADAQSNTFRGKLVNTTEAVIATLARAIDPLLTRLKPALDKTFGFFSAHGDAIVSFVERVAIAVDHGIDAVRDWLGEHQSLVQELLGMAAVAGVAVVAYGAIGLAIAALSSPITLAIAGVVALALTWEKVREWSEVEIGGRPIAGYVSATVTALGGMVMALAVGLKGAVQTIVSFITALFNDAMERASRLTQAIGELVGSDRLTEWATKAREFWAAREETSGDVVGTFQKAADDLREAIEIGNDAIGIAYESKKLPGVADLVKDSWQGAADWLEAKLPKLGQLGKAAADALAGLAKTSTGNTKTGDGKLAAQLKKTRDEYEEWIAGFRTRAEADGDPLSRALANVEVERGKAIAKLEKQKARLKDAIGIDWTADEKTVNAFFDAKRDAEIQKADERFADRARADFQTITRLARDIAEQQLADSEEKRLALIHDSTQRELAMRLSAIERWARERSEDITASIADEKQRDKALALIERERQRRISEAEDEALRLTRERTVGTAEFWKKTAEEIKAQYRGIAEVVREVIVSSRSALGNATQGFLDDLASGQADLMKSLTGLSKGLTSLWTKALSDILLSGKNVAKQLQDLFKSIHVKNEDGSTDWMGTALAGAGFGGTVGGLFSKPNNYAAEGGSLGGAIGAVIGTLAGGNTALGAVIGTAIGTAVGSVIQKGKDSIKVAIRDGVVSVTEKGISAEARAEVTTQIQRRVKEEMKSWQSLLNLLPQSVRDHLKELYATGKLQKPTLNLTGGVESADLTDEGALNALTDFLGNDVPKATFGAYSEAIKIAFAQLGVGSKRIADLFAYYGTLQGKELRDAVARYVTVTLDAIDLRAKLGASVDDKLAAAREYGQTKPLVRLDEIASALDAAVARMATLTDVEDLVSAQEEVNRLSKQ